MLGFLGHKFRVWKSVRREKQKDKTRSSQWPAVRAEHLKAHPLCATCSSTLHVQVHHVEPYHLHPELELSQGNLISLCMSENECHIRIGHGDDFKAFNPKIREHATRLKKSPHIRAIVEKEAKALRQYADVKK